MGKSQLFDNLMQVIHAENVIAGTDTVSIEIDLELPRGYVAKIRKIKMEVDSILSRWASGEGAEFSGALVLDPDDLTSAGFPSDSVEHDVIAEHNAAIESSTTEFVVVTNFVEWVCFEDKEDVITARNMRWNTSASEADFNTGTHEVTIYYTLEKIHDTQIMELLDIL